MRLFFRSRSTLLAAMTIGALVLTGCGGDSLHGSTGSGGSASGSGGATSASGSTSTSGSGGASGGTGGAANIGGSASGGNSGSGGTSSSSGGSSGSGGLAIVQSFDGDTGPGLATCQMPGHCNLPEMNAAASGSQVVQVTWQNVKVFDHSGNILSTTALPAFITNAGLTPTSGSVPKPYEPHVVFDEFIQRWIITASCKYDCLLVSASSDAQGGWAGIYVDNDGSDPSMHLGYDKNGVYIEENQPGTNAAANQNGTAGIYFAIPAAEMKWVGTFNPTHKNRAANRPLDGSPALDQNPNKLPTDPAFSVTKSCNGNCQNATNLSFDWVVTSVTWSGTTATYGSDRLVMTGVGSSQNLWLYNTPIAAVSQPGTAGQIRPIEGHRVLSVGQNGSHLVTALGSGPCTSAGPCATQGLDANNLFFWVDLDCTNASSCVVSQTGKVSDPTNHLAFPTVGVASNGNIGIVAGSLGAGIYPSILAWGRSAGDPANTLTGPITVMTGTQPDTCVTSPVSYANAAGLTTVRDPVDPTKLWTTHQYSDSASPCVWQTRIVELSP